MKKSKKYCISVDAVKYVLQLCGSDLQGFYLYELIPMQLGDEPKFMYIAPDRTDHWMDGKPMQGGKQIALSQILYFYTY